MFLSKRLIRIFLVLLIILNFSIAEISRIVYLPEYVSIITSALILIIVFGYFREENRWIRYLYFVFSFTSMIYSVYSSYFSPYWNSRNEASLNDVYKSSNRPETLIAGDDAIDDLDFCIKIIRKVHPSCVNGLSDELSQEFIKCRKQISCTDSISINDLHRALQSCISYLYDAHTDLHAYYDSTHYIPISTSDTIIAINGIDFSTFLAQKRTLYSAESDEYARWRLLNDLHTYEGLLFIGFAKDDAIDFTVVSKDGCTDSVIVQMRDYTRWWPGKRSSVAKERSWDYQIFDSIDVAFFDLRDCSALSRSYKQNLRIAFDQFFSSVISHDINNIVLNLCNNHGGNDIPRQLFMRYLPTDEYRICKRYSRYGPFMIKRNNGYCYNNKSDIQFYGKIFVLTSKYTFSAATMFADVLQGNGLATIVGETSSNAINCHSGCLSYILPHSNLVLEVSHSQYTRTNQTEINDFVIPDVQCSPENGFMMVRKIIGK